MVATPVSVASPSVEGDEQRRGARWALRRVLWRVTKLRRLATCGRGARAGAVDVLVTTDVNGDRRGSTHGLITCSSVWSCPVCATHVRSQRAAEISQALGEHRARGGGGFFVTLTLRHAREDGLEDLLAALYGSWRAVQQRTGWRTLKRAAGVVGWVRGAEVTYGVNGWHPHLHVAVLTEGPATQKMRDKLEGWLQDAWIAETGKYGHGGLEGVAVQVQRMKNDPTSWERIAGYAVDGSKMHHELARGDRKKPWEGESYGPFDILDAAGDGEAWALRRWWEYEDATSGRRAIEWSRGLRDLLGLGSERTDEELTGDAVAETAETVELVATLTDTEWLDVCAADLDFEVVTVAVTDGAAGVAAMVTAAAAYREAERQAAGRTKRVTVKRRPPPG